MSEQVRGIIQRAKAKAGYNMLGRLDPEIAARISGEIEGDRKSCGAAHLQFALEYYESGDWIGQRFNEFDDWLEYCADTNDIGYTLKATMGHFAQRLTPWLHQHPISVPAEVVTEEGELIAISLDLTPESLSEIIGYSLIHDITSSAGKLWVHVQQNPGDQAAVEQLDEQIEACLRKVTERGMTRSKFDEWLKEQGYRESRDRSERFPYTTVLLGDGQIAMIIICPTDRAADYLEKRLDNTLEAVQSALIEIAPGLVSSMKVTESVEEYSD